VSQYQTSSIVDASSIVNYVTIIGRVYPDSSEDYTRLARLAWGFQNTPELGVSGRC
jgi:hypothetical protein